MRTQIKYGTPTLLTNKCFNFIYFHCCGILVIKSEQKNDQQWPSSDQLIFDQNKVNESINKLCL